LEKIGRFATLPVVGKSSKNIFSQMVVKNGDLHITGSESVKDEQKSPTKTKNPVIQAVRDPT